MSSLPTFYPWSKSYWPKISKNFDIKLVVYGENQAEYGNPIDDNQNPFMDLKFFSADEPKKCALEECRWMIC